MEGKFCHILNRQIWLSKFPSGDLSLQESDRSGRPSKIDNNVFRFMLENNLHLTSQEIAEEFGIYHTTVGDHIKSLGKGGILTRILREKNLTANQEHHQQQFQNEVSINEKYCFGVVGQERYSLLRIAEAGKTLNADLYSNQLDKLNTAIKEKGEQ
ncbi:histone-lysine N-methyltransferase SETMAR [Trichonephila clavipes]|nr:histone-lysine N-methyltransferase SETMAR [Trichonephila clavipes]